MFKSTGLLILASSLTLAACAGRPPHSRDHQSQGPSVNRQHISGIVTPAGLVLASFDQNQDARLTSSEIRSGAEVVFEASDQDQNGVLAGIELAGFSQHHLGARYTVPGRIAFDPNGDSVTTLDEFTAVWLMEFQTLNRDQDEYLTRAELIRQLASPTNGQSGPRGQGGRGPGGPRGPGG